MNRQARRTLTATSLISTAMVATMAAGVTLTWTFLPGGEITATNVGDLGAVTSRGTVVTCINSVAKVVAKSGSGLSGQDIGSINEFDLKGNSTHPSDERCITSPGGILVEIIPLNLPWKFDVESYDLASGIVSAKVTGVKARIHGSDGCSVEWTAPGGSPGEVHVKYDNTTGIVKAEPADPNQPTDPINSTLVASVLTGTCDSDFVREGDKLAIAGHWEVRPIQSVTSP